MNLFCHFCGLRNPAVAHFCGGCGRQLDRGRSQAERRGQSILLLVILLSAWLVFVGPPKFLGAGWALPNFAGVRQPVQRLVDRIFRDASEKRVLTLSGHQKNAVYDMLSPNDVRVIVGRDNGSIYVEGTRAECEAMSEFAQMLSETWDCPNKTGKVEWTTTTYQLPHDKSQSLCHTLSVAGMDQYIECHKGEVIVNAGREERETIRRVAKILKGERF